MKEEIKSQLAIIKDECFKLSQILNWDRLNLTYDKSRKFNDSGQLNIANIQHFYSS